MPEEPSNKIAYLLDELDKHLGTFDRKANWYRGVYFSTSMVLLLLSGLIAVIAGWKSQDADQASRVILVLGTLSTIVAGYGMFFSPKESWLLCATTSNRMRGLKAKIEFMEIDLKTPEDADKLAAECHAELQAILDAQNEAWLNLRSPSLPATSSSRTQAAAP